MTSSGIDRSSFDETLRPADDLYRYVNGGWLARFTIPPDRAVDGAFRALHDRAEAQVREIVEELAADDAAQGTDALVGRLYRAFMDTARIERLGTDPIKTDTDLVDAVDTRAELAWTMGRLERTGVSGAIGWWVDNDPDDPDRYVVNLTQSGLGLPDESYYREERYAQVRSAYVTHIASMLALTGLPGGKISPARAAERIMALETRLAAGHWDVVQARDAEKTHNPMTLAALRERIPGFPWKQWATGLGASDQALADVVVREVDFFDALGTAWVEVDLVDWRLWLAWHVVSARAPFLDEEVVDENFAFYGRTLTGAEQLRERWKRGIGLVEGVLGEAVGKAYVARHFPPEAKERMNVLVADLVEAYRQSIEQLDWMTEATRARALEKLAAFTPKIGYPTVWRDYSALKLVEGDLVGGVRAAGAFETDRELGKIGKPVDREEWFMTPQTVNAYYNPGMNEIVFPAAILQPPFFDMDAEDAANYGGIGAVIGHEIGHGFDDQGSKYDGTGRLVDWWTEADRTEFEARTRALIAQYDAFVPEGLDAEHHVNGALTIGENIGDLGGLGIAIKAYALALARAAGDGAETLEGPEIEGWSALQRLFYGWAQCWRTAIRPAEAIRRVAVDPHSPAEFRCNGVVRNLAEFYLAFDVREGDGLYLEPSQRVTIW